MHALRDIEYEYRASRIIRTLSAIRMFAISFVTVQGLAAFYLSGVITWKSLIITWLAVGASFVLEREFVHLVLPTKHTGRTGDEEPDQEPAYRPPAPRHRDREAYLVLTLFGFLSFGLYHLLWTYDSGVGLGPGDAPAIAAVAVSAPTLIALGLAAVPRILRAWGARARDTGQGKGAASFGEADVIRAQKEGEAAVLRAQAEMKRAEAEYLRAEKGLDPLPPAQLPPPDQLPALPPGSGNGATPGGAPQLPSA
ncbi:hypothetical protein [Streptomyces sp. NPDC051214]|uniref:hypothetical protein n=1 Tax=Streptomyces sp. NPDC051214 TaxID=3155282 RepID=UPI003443358A